MNEEALSVQMGKGLAEVLFSGKNKVPRREYSLWLFMLKHRLFLFLFCEYPWPACKTPVMVVSPGEEMGGWAKAWRETVTLP